MALEARNPAILIMAGGKGERFWPLSRRDLPKQFLRLCGGGTLLQETYRRATLLVPRERVFVVTPDEYRDLTFSQLPDLPAENLIMEPAGRDTAPCVGLASVYIDRTYPDATMVVMPADHLISNEGRFLSLIGTAAAVAAGGQQVVLLGITPTRPETGYGYIRCGQVAGEEDGHRIRAVECFTEKPDLERAVEFLATGDYLWNSGMFALRTSTLNRMIQTHLPWLKEGLSRIAAALGKPEERGVVQEEFTRFPRISLDYGVIERAENAVVIPADFGWDDVGSWAALDRTWQPDGQGNVVRGQVVTIDTENCIVYGAGDRGLPGNKLAVVYGVEGLLVVDTDDVLLVTAKEKSVHLKQVIERLRAQGLERFLGSPRPPAATGVTGVTAASIAGGLKIVEKPWGRETWWAVTDRYVGKIIEVDAGHSLSLQYHRSKLETMLFTRGQGTLVLGDERLAIREGLCVTIDPGMLHRVEAETGLTFYEVSTPETADVVRVEDDYGRA